MPCESIQFVAQQLPECPVDTVPREHTSEKVILGLTVMLNDHGLSFSSKYWKAVKKTTPEVVLPSCHPELGWSINAPHWHIIWLQKEGSLTMLYVIGFSSRTGKFLKNS